MKLFIAALTIAASSFATHAYAQTNQPSTEHELRMLESYTQSVCLKSHFETIGRDTKEISLIAASFIEQSTLPAKAFFQARTVIETYQPAHEKHPEFDTSLYKCLTFKHNANVRQQLRKLTAEK